MSMPREWGNRVDEWRGLNWFTEAEIARFERIFQGTVPMETPIEIVDEIVERAAIASRRVKATEFADWCEKYRRGEVQPTEQERDAWLSTLGQLTVGGVDLSSREAVQRALSGMSPGTPVTIILPIACAAVVHAARGIGRGKAPHIEARFVELALLAGLSLARVELASE